MSIQSYVPVDNLPAPVTSGSVLESITDVLGDAWVAKNGVNGGAWKRARDVLHGFWGRAAAMNATSTSTVIPMDTKGWDDYGLYSGNGFQIPVAGFWLVSCHAVVTPTAASQTFGLSMYRNTNPIAGWVSMVSSTTVNIHCWQSITARCSVGDAISLYCNTNSPTLAVVGGWTYNNLQVDYLGTG